MPPMPVLTPEDRAKSKRWEHIVGKDWTTRVMLREGLSREDARKIVLQRIEQVDKETLDENHATDRRFTVYFGGMLRAVRNWHGRRTAGTNL